MVSGFVMSVWSTTDSGMADSAFNIVNDVISEIPPAISFEKIEVKENVLVRDASNNDVARSSSFIYPLLHMAAENSIKAAFVTYRN